MFAEKLAEMQTAFDSKLQEALEKQAAADATKRQQLVTESAEASFFASVDAQGGGQQQRANRRSQSCLRARLRTESHRDQTGGGSDARRDPGRVDGKKLDLGAREE